MRSEIQKIFDLLVDAEARTFCELDDVGKEADRVRLKALDQKIKDAVEQAYSILCGVVCGVDEKKGEQE